MRRTHWHSDAVDLGYPQRNDNEVRTQVDESDVRANLVASLLHNGLHAPAFDLDLPCELRPSSTPGNHHLLIDKPMKWWRYRLMLRMLVFVGVIEKKYYKHSVRRGMTMLRLPHVKKGVRVTTFHPVSQSERNPQLGDGLQHDASHRVETSTSGLHKRCIEPGCDWHYEYD